MKENILAHFNPVGIPEFAKSFEFGIVLAWFIKNALISLTKNTLYVEFFWNFVRKFT
jgi:hypothetical protein